MRVIHLVSLKRDFGALKPHERAQFQVSALLWGLLVGFGWCWVAIERSRERAIESININTELSDIISLMAAAVTAVLLLKS